MLVCRVAAAMPHQRARIEVGMWAELSEYPPCPTAHPGPTRILHCFRSSKSRTHRGGGLPEGTDLDVATCKWNVTEGDVRPGWCTNERKVRCLLHGRV